MHEMASKDTNAPHEHPHTSIPVRISKESSFAGPGSDTPDKATQQRPKRDVGTPQDHPVNRPIADEDKSLIGVELGKGGVDQPMKVQTIPDQPPHEVDEGIHDVTALIGKLR
jgi:hypothetical protein